MVLLALDLIWRVSSCSTPQDLISWINGFSGASSVIVNPRVGGSGGGYSAGRIFLGGALIHYRYTDPGNFKTIIHEMAHGINQSLGNSTQRLSYTTLQGFVSWVRVPSGRWIYIGQPDVGPANSYLTTPSEDYANSFAAVVIEQKQNRGRMDLSNNDLSNIVALTGDRNNDTVIGVDELVRVSGSRESIIMNSLQQC